MSTSVKLKNFFSFPMQKWLKSCHGASRKNGLFCIFVSQFHWWLSRWVAVCETHSRYSNETFLTIFAHRPYTVHLVDLPDLSKYDKLACRYVFYSFYAKQKCQQILYFVCERSRKILSETFNWKESKASVVFTSKVEKLLSVKLSIR